MFSVPMPINESLASSCVLTATQAEARAIIVFSKTGSTSRNIIKYRPIQPVIVGIINDWSEGSTYNGTGLTADEASAQVLPFQYTL
jgi:pyruvate kinase